MSKTTHEDASYSGFLSRVPTGEYAPISAWGYLGYKLLFSIPIIGFIFLIVFSFSDSNLNRRSFARSYWCAALLGLILFAVIMAFGIASGVLFDAVEKVQNILYTL